MKKYEISISCFLFAFMSCFSGIAQDKWKLAKDSKEIKVYTRRLESTGFKEIKAITLVDATLEDCVNLLKNEKAATLWVDRMIDYYNLKVENDSLWYTYGEIEIPWPFNNKDFVGENTLYSMPDSGKYIIRISSVPDYYPEKDGKKRIKQSEGTWLFKQKADGKVEASHSIYAEANDFLPPWLVNWVVIGSVFKTFEGFREQLKKTP